MNLYRLYKWSLAIAVIIIVLLFLFLPRVSAKADVEAHLSQPVVVPSNEDYIRRYAALYGVNPDLAVRIAACESRLYARAKNPGSSAKGLYQFIDSSWQRYAKLHWGEVGEAYSPEDSADLGAWVLAKYGMSDWNASKACWGA